MRTQLISMILAVAPTIALANTPKAAKAPASLDVTSSAFTAGGDIPSELTCDGADTSPPLAWGKVPANTKSIAILVDDPDAPKGTFTHWLVVGLPPTMTELDKGGTLPQGAIATKNDKGTTGYTGPCPPTGRHHYQFRVYALDTMPAKSMTRTEFLKAVEGHIVATGQLIGMYQRSTAR